MDTSVLIAAEREKFAWERFLHSVRNESLFISAITLSELWHGCHRASPSALPRRLQFVKDVETRIPTLGFSTQEAHLHSKIWANLEKSGHKIGDYDLIIAATARAFDYPIATLNENEFKRIPLLKLWPLVNFILK